VRDFPAEDTDQGGPQSAVPVAGRGKKPPTPDTGGMEPQPT
jgi:cell division protease FtsH